jgi:lipopolysaccharide transport system ATP-binding protein
MITIGSQENKETKNDLSNTTAIRVHNLSKVYKLYPDQKARMKEALHPMRRKYHKDYYALNRVSFDVNKGEVFGIIGKNGSGKSTLLKIVAEVLQPTSGWVQANGKISALLELGSGFNPDFTGLENVYFYGSIMGHSREEMEAKLEEIISFADIGEFINQPLKNYSNGMKARLAFAVAINIDPEILIVDEVLAVGDELFRRKCYAKLETFMGEGKTILFVTHNMETTNELCTRAVMLDSGKLILEGASKMVTEQYKRFIFAKEENRNKIIKELILFNQNISFKKKMEGEDHNSEKHLIKNEYQNSKSSDELIKNNNQKPQFVKGLISRSIVEYKNYDVDIYEFTIKTNEDRRVNLLVTGEEYIYSYKVKFNLDAKDVSFGMKIKNEKGAEISGAALFKEKPVTNVKRGEIYLVQWRFNCRLLHGIYYTNAGVSSIIDNRRVFLNRVVDAVVFKVQKMNKSMYGGIAHLDQKVEIRKIV